MGVFVDVGFKQYLFMIFEDLGLLGEKQNGVLGFDRSAEALVVQLILEEGAGPS